MKIKFIIAAMLVNLLIINSSSEKLDALSPEFTYVNIDSVFGDYMVAVDRNIYNALSVVNNVALQRIYGDINTPMFEKACQWVNPCMAMATTWGESGRSYPGISITTMMDFNPESYIMDIDWISLSLNFEQVDSLWYYSNAKESSCNINASGYAYHIPLALCQRPKDGNTAFNSMYELGVGPYQHTSKDWSYWDLDMRVNPVWGWYGSFEKVGNAWLKCGIDPISDLTVYACLSLGHQGGSLITMDFGLELIKYINQESTQKAFNKVGKQMYDDLREMAVSASVSVSKLDTAKYLKILEKELSVDFSKYHRDGYGSTNKGTYVARHCLSYVFYKNYFGIAN